MNKRTRFGLLGLATALILLALAWHWHVQASLLSSQLALAQDRSERSQAELEALRAKVLAEETLLVGTERELDGAIAKASEPLPKKVKITRKQLLARLEEARAQVKALDYKAAGESYLWCLDRALAEPERFDMSWNRLALEVVEFSKLYPILRDALLSRSALFGARVLADPDYSPSCVASLNQALGSYDRNLSLYDQLSQSSRQRSTILIYGYAGFVEAKRYQELVAMRGYTDLSFEFDVVSPKITRQGASASETHEEYFEQAVRYVEVLAGVNDLEHASSLGSRVLAWARTPEERARVEKAFARAGHAELWGRLGQ